MSESTLELQEPKHGVLYTFGNSKVAVTIARILINSNDMNLLGSINKLFSHFAIALKAIQDVKSKHTKNYLAKLIVDDYMDKAQALCFGNEVGTYVLNLLNSKYKQFIEGSK